MLFDFDEVEWVSRKTNGGNSGRQVEYGIRITAQQNGKRPDGGARWANCAAIALPVLDKFGIEEGERFLIGKIERSGKMYIVIAKKPDGYTLCMGKKGKRSTGFVKFAHGAHEKTDLPFADEIEVPVSAVSCFGDALFFEMPEKRND